MKTISIEVAHMLNDESNNTIVFKIAAITKENNTTLNIYSIKDIILKNEDYISAVSSLKNNEKKYLKSLCVLTEEEQNKIAFLRGLL